MSAPATRFLLARRAGGLASLDLSTGGTFTRATEASYLTGAPTDGSSAFLAWAIANARRIENRGDGLGDMLLMEGSRTNYLLQSRDLANAAWTAGTATLTSNANGGVDGATLADRINAASGQYSHYQLTPGPAGLVSMSGWARAVAGSASYQIALNHNNGSAIVKAGVKALTTTYGRNDCSASATLNTGPVPLDGRDNAAVGGQVATAQDIYFDLAQLEAGAFPSSPIRTTTAAVTRGADVLSYVVGQYPPSFLTRGFRVRCAPDFSSVENTGLTEDLIGMATITNGGAAFDGATFLVYRPGVGWLTTACSWSRGQLLTVEVRPGVSVTLSGFTTGDGTYALSGTAWVADTLSVGQRDVSGNIPFFGRIGLTIEAL